MTPRPNRPQRGSSRDSKTGRCVHSRRHSFRSGTVLLTLAPQALLGDYAPSLFNYALELHLRGDRHVPEAAKGSGGEVLRAEMASPDILAAADAYRRTLTSCATSEGSSAGGRVCAAAACNNLGVLHYAHSELANYTAAKVASLSVGCNLMRRHGFVQWRQCVA